MINRQTSIKSFRMEAYNGIVQCFSLRVIFLYWYLLFSKKNWSKAHEQKQTTVIILLLSHMNKINKRKFCSSTLSIDIPEIPLLLVCAVCVCMCIHVGILIYLKAIQRCLSIYFHVPWAHLALVTASVTCVWFCSIPAPIAPLWESSVMTECCWAFAAAVPRNSGNMGGSFLQSGLEMVSCWPGCYFFSPLSLSSGWLSSKSEWSQWLFYPVIYVIPRVRCCQLIHVLFLSVTELALAATKHLRFSTTQQLLVRCDAVSFWLKTNLKRMKPHEAAETYQW